VERVAALVADGESMLSPVVIDVIERRELDVPLAAAAAADVAATVAR
jgi:hypothetical protein